MACWKWSRLERFDDMVEMMSGGGESLLMASPMMTALSVDAFDITEEKPVISEEESIAQIVLGIFEINQFLDEIIAQESKAVDLESIYKMKDSLDEIYTNLKNAYNDNKERSM